MYIKDFDKWNDTKKKIQNDIFSGKFRSGEIRWSGIGINIGSEIDGKGNEFLRPVLIIEKAAPDLYLVIPMSTKIKDSLGYRKLELHEKTVSFCIHQIKIISSKRIFARIEKLPSDKMIEIKNMIKEYFRF